MTLELTLLDIKNSSNSNDTPTVAQYRSGLAKMMTMAGLADADLAEMPATVETYLQFAPKFSKRNTSITTLIATTGWKAATYRQYQSDGRRMIEHMSGSLAARTARRTKTDDWSAIMERAKALNESGLLTKYQLAALGSFANACRAKGLSPQDVNSVSVADIVHQDLTSEERKKLVRGAACFDYLCLLPTMRDLLPKTPIGALPVVVKKPAFSYPAHLEAEAHRWVVNATTSIPEALTTEKARECFATEHSDGAKGIFYAVMHRFLHAATALPSNGLVNSVASLARNDLVETIIADWIQATKAETSGSLSPRTLYQYCQTLELLLKRNECPAVAAHVKLLMKNNPILLEGKVAGKFMSPATEAWCRALISNQAKIDLFEVQHVFYAQQARAALEEAKAAGFDLVKLVKEDRIMALPPTKRSRAKALLSRARMFGVCAAYAAIGVEGPPFRRVNILGLKMSGRQQTFFDHSLTDAQYYRILIPNELLKNGKSLTLRNFVFPPTDFCNEEIGSFAFDILDFFIQNIRTLFPDSNKSHSLFAPLSKEHDELNKKTFSRWLAQCSAEIGLPLTSHNLRHGRASIMINENPNCIQDIALLLGDRPETVQRFYAFFDTESSLTRMQKDRNAHRARMRLSLNRKAA